MILQIGNKNKKFHVVCVLFSIERLQQILIKKTNKHQKCRYIYSRLSTDMKRSFRTSEACQFFLFLVVCYAQSFSLVFMSSFSQANFTFLFVENLKTYSQTWLRMSEGFKNRGNVLMVSRLQVGEMWYGFRRSNELIQVNCYTCKATHPYGCSLKKN